MSLNEFIIATKDSPSWKVLIYTHSGARHYYIQKIKIQDLPAKIIDKKTQQKHTDYKTYLTSLSKAHDFTQIKLKILGIVDDAYLMNSLHFVIDLISILANLPGRHFIWEHYLILMKV